MQISKPPAVGCYVERDTWTGFLQSVFMPVVPVQHGNLNFLLPLKEENANFNFFAVVRIIVSLDSRIQVPASRAVLTTLTLNCCWEKGSVKEAN